MEPQIQINTNILTWAIGRAGYDLPDFIIKFPKIQDWLDQTKQPTVRQLEDFSHKVHVPFGYLFLPEPPNEKPLIPFFRTGKSISSNVNLNIRDTIMLLQKRQAWLREYLADEGFEPLEFVGKFDAQSNHFDIVSDIRKTLGLSENWASTFPSWEKAKEHLAMQIEEAGIILNFNSVVENNNHRPIKVDECRGFVLVDKFAPFLFVNAADAKAAQMFTIVHELAHVWVGQSAGFDFQGMLPADDPLEKLCDRVAAEFLVPESAFLQFWKENPSIWAAAKKFKVSPIVIGRRALDLGKIDKGYFFKFYNDHVAKLKNAKDQKPKSGGGDFYLTQKQRLSTRFMAHLNQAVKENKILYRDVYKLTGLNGETFQKFISKIL